MGRKGGVVDESKEDHEHEALTWVEKGSPMGSIHKSKGVLVGGVGDPSSHLDDRERRNKVENNTRRQDLRGSAKLPTSTAALGIFYSISREHQSYKELPIYIEEI